MADYADTSGDEKPKGKKLGYLELMQAENIVPLLSEEELASISAKVTGEYEIDEQSRTDWLEKNTAALELAMMVAGDKDYPFKNASNVKYPLVATAALQFNARAYPAIVPPDRVVKCKTFGKDPDGQKAARAERVSDHMSWQLTSQMPEWEEDTDRLTLIVSIAGSCFRKVFYDLSLGRNVTRLVTADRLVYNYWARSFVDLPRLTEIMTLYPNEVQERINDRRFVDFDYANLETGDTNPNGSQTASTEDGDAPHTFLEQHRLLDLDGDGYSEPYIVTVHKGSGKVCRIVANWTAETAQLAQDKDGAIKVVALRRRNYYVRYLFLPSPDGGAYGLGFGWLLSDINHSINTTLNQTFDAAHLANIQGGFISSALAPKQRGGTFRFEQGEWKYLNTTGALRDAIMPITYPGPSQVLMVLLEFLINAGKELASIKDVLTGDTPATAAVGTTLAMIEQGLQVFTSIYKRIHRGLREELRLLGDLNADHVNAEEYKRFHDAEADPQKDYNSDDMDILPVSDPQSVTKAQKIAKAQAIYSLSNENPTMDRAEATKRVLEAIDAEDIEKLMPPPPPPDPKIAELAQRAAEAEVSGLEATAEEKIANATAKLAAAIKSIADAEGVEMGSQIGIYAQIVDMLKTEHAMENDIVGQVAGQGGVPGVAGQPNDPMGAGPMGAGIDGGGAGSGGQPVPVEQLPPGGMGAGAANGGVPQGAL